MRPIKWFVDRDITVDLCDTRIEIRQGDCIGEGAAADDGMESIEIGDGSEVESLIRALIHANDAAGWDMPDLSAEGYKGES